MLSRAVSNRIKEFGQSTLHDYWFTSLFAGEPHFEDGMMVYFDGRVVCLCGFPLQCAPPIEDAQVIRLAQKWIRDRGAESVIYLGPRAVRLNRLKDLGLRRVAEQKPWVVSAELFIDCSESSTAALHQRVYRRSRALNFSANVTSGGFASAEYFELIEVFYRAREITNYLAEIAFALPVLLRSKRVQLVEARKNGKLSGFIALHKPFSKTAVGLFMAGHPEVPGVCDFLYSAMLDEANRLGATRVNVGPSPSVGHFNFKKKWGGAPAVAPYYFVQWARGVLAQRNHTSWGPRLLRIR
jgi:hypothetical protein